MDCRRRHPQAGGTGRQPHPAGDRGGRGKGRRRCGASVLAGQRKHTGLALERHTLVPGRRPQGLGSAWMAAAAAVGGAPGRPTPPLQCFPRMGRRPPAGGRGGPLTPPGGPVGDVAHPAYPGKVASRGDPPALSKPPTASPVTKTGSNTSPPRRHQLPLHDAER